jgi:hypothetical protein
MALMAEYVNIHRVENGWVVQFGCAGSSVTLIAKSLEEIGIFLEDVEWHSPRPLPAYDGPMPATMAGPPVGRP